MRRFLIASLTLTILFMLCIEDGLSETERSPSPSLGSSPLGPSERRPAPPSGIRPPGIPAAEIPNCPVSKSLSVPLWKQETVSWCWAASSQTMMDYRGVKEDQCYIVDRVRQNQLGGGGTITSCCIAKKNSTLECTFLGEPEWALDEFNFIYDRKGQAQFGWPELCREISGDRPFIYAETYTTGTGHTYVVRGYGKDSNGVRVIEIYDHDPQFVGTPTQTNYVEWPYEEIRIPEQGEDPHDRTSVDYYIDIHR